MNVLPYFGTYTVKIAVNEGACLSATAAVNISESSTKSCLSYSHSTL